MPSFGNDLPGVIRNHAPNHRVRLDEASAARGDVKPAEEVFARLEAKYKALVDQQKLAAKRRP